MKCPKCNGTLTKDWEQPSCINCGFVVYSEFEVAKSRREAELRRSSQVGVDGRSDRGKRHEPYHLAS